MSAPNSAKEFIEAVNKLHGQLLFGADLPDDVDEWSDSLPPKATQFVLLALGDLEAAKRHLTLTGIFEKEESNEK